MKKISLLGATGSVGVQTDNVVRHHPEHFQIVALAFGENVDKGLELIHTHRPKLVSVKNKETADKLKGQLASPVKVVYGLEGLIEVAAYPEADVTVNAVLGSIGLEPTLAAIAAGKIIALANKETLVTAGHLVMAAAKEKHVPILPVDSEHSAIFQSLNGEKQSQIKRLILTASGGSFRDKTRDELHNVTIEEALNHPNWSMGAKITIDSATMMNKGLEVIEAHWLFDVPYEKIDVLIHKESIVHSLVEYIDNSVIAELGHSDMRLPIQYALTYPDRLELTDTKQLNLWEVGQLHFQKVDMERYRSVKFAYDAGRAGGTMPTVLNAANEEAVAAFLKGAVTFLDIEGLVLQALEKHHTIQHPTLETIRMVDKEIRRAVQEAIRQR
ncbi:1-deoxy-D-xylulose 5-phosphate reductoisomerase 2 [Pullulanibacillus camelliae]|uniref:1-deoxy-D-xylulose 5-phosphate reductoisomerase n=1 Tax=Pullulanibacillus camelliae TaxID=1707096 RepID=A0A8J2YJA0_9BACL|nr:1-deoxy-D-xylulose-5-phosphate reductoisomerase [Pullulanibacillus camelliae]GGE46281.1 1-deoxy-D-xylulose 5-phosphate reductoisomerase 2 [Pullulanibacillus camelliae]